MVFGNPPVMFTKIRRSANDVTFGYRDVSYARGSGCNAVTSIYLISQHFVGPWLHVIKTTQTYMP